MADPSRGIGRKIVAHYRAHKRDLPWRRTRDPYAIWVSEIMLQQTRVATVIPYYERWLASFPTVVDLAEADLDEVLSHWTGLGYYSRARNLHKGAREVVASYGGRVPGTASELLKIPGIGRYTAGAISSMAFDQREALVDGNVARVLARVFAIEDDIKSSAGQKKLWQLAESMVPASCPGDFNQGLMELGACICTPKNPSCDDCPVAGSCLAKATGQQDRLPVVPRRKRRDEKPLLQFEALWTVRRGRLLLGQRPAEGLYGGLWELPQAATRDELAALIPAKLTLAPNTVVTREHELSHRRLSLRVWPGTIKGSLKSATMGPYARIQWHPLEQLDDCGLSAVTQSIIASYKKDIWTNTKKL